MRSWIIIALLTFVVACSNEKKTEERKEEVAAEKIPLPPIENKEVVSFVYHRFDDSRFPSTNIAAADFEEHLAWLLAHDYKVLTLSQAITYLKSDQEPQSTAVITIDDGYKSFYKSGLPLLVKYGMPATLFINTETVGAGDYMSWDELKDAAEKNIEIGNHTHSHKYFLNDEATGRYTAFVADLELSQKLIEENLRIKPTVFAYPYGEFDEEMKMIVKAIGFRGAAAQNSGVINTGTDLFQLPRFPMSESFANMFEEKALTQSLPIIRKSATHPMIPRGKDRPVLTLAINPKSLNIDRMQCFVQGSRCQMKITDKTSNEITVTLRSSGSIMSRRRTLYTLTVPDSAGNWHWFSHLWINPSVK